MSSNDIQSAVSYILENEERLEIACTVRDAWEDLRKQVITKFVNRFSQLLEEHDWQVTLDWKLANALDKSAWLRARCGRWNPGQFLHLAGETWGPNNVCLSFLGIPESDPKFGEYQSKLQDLGWSSSSAPSADSEKSRPWQVRLEEVFQRTWWYSNWTSPQAIKRMGGQHKEDFAKELLEVFEKARQAIGEVAPGS